MSIYDWTLLIVSFTFVIYVIIAILTRASSTNEFFVAGKGVSPIANGAATAADWMSAASFLGMAGAIAVAGRDGSVYLMGWTGGYVLLALCLAPYLRKFGKYTVPDFVGERYESSTARVIAVICALFVSFTYVVGQMRGVGLVFSRFLEIDINRGVVLGMLIVFFYAVLGGMKGITYTQVAQYCVLIFAYMTPILFISMQLTGNIIPQIGFGSELVDGSGYLLDKLDGLHQELGFANYTDGSMSRVNLFFITLALMLGTAGLPHVIVRFYTVKHVRDARSSVFWALLFISILYLSAPAVAAFARYNILTSLHNETYTDAPSWFKNYEKTKLVAWLDKNDDGRIQIAEGDAFYGKPEYAKTVENEWQRGDYGQPLLKNAPNENPNELFMDKDIIILANPEVANLPNWLVALVAAGGLAAALSTAAGLLLVISTAFSHDLMKKTFMPNLSERAELATARASASVAVLIAGYFGINPPGYVAEVVAFAFGLAAATFFPVIFFGIFTKRVNKYGAIFGMLVGLIFTLGYIIYFEYLYEGLALAKAEALSESMNELIQPIPAQEKWFYGISPKGIGVIGAFLNTIVMLLISFITPKPSSRISKLVDFVRSPG